MRPAARAIEAAGGVKGANPAAEAAKNAAPGTPPEDEKVLPGFRCAVAELFR
jgi:hypothetical protein